MGRRTLWILSEERPKITSVRFVLEKFREINPCELTCSDGVQIVPVLDAAGRFTFWFEVVGVRCDAFDRILVGIVSGYSSFVDYLVFLSETKPSEGDTPLFVVEETKTDDSESRNTGVFQRGSKFVYVDFYFPGISKTMFYNIQIDRPSTVSRTNVFGTRCLVTLGVDIRGKEISQQAATSFTSNSELIAAKNEIATRRGDNVPIAMSEFDNRMEISARLVKADSLSHDPNIGAVSLLASTARKLGLNKPIVVTRHGLLQRHVRNSKFVQIASALDIRLDGLTVNKVSLPVSYWRYDVEGEKLGTILVHVTLEGFGRMSSVFENHAGSEKGYFIAPSGEPLQLAKYVPGSRKKAISIPDLILRDPVDGCLLNIEGKKTANLSKGLSALDTYGDIESIYLTKYYPEDSISRSVVLFGGRGLQKPHKKVSVLLGSDGQIWFGEAVSTSTLNAFSRVRDYWESRGFALAKELTAQSK